MFINRKYNHLNLKRAYNGMIKKGIYIFPQVNVYSP